MSRDAEFDLEALLTRSLNGELPSDQQALRLVTELDTARLADTARKLRDRGFLQTVTYSPKVFLPLTQLCRDVCHYCTFAKTPKRISQPYMTVEQAVEEARAAVAVGCKEALLTLGEKPELRYSKAREALAEMGFNSTLEYVAHVAKRIFEETGILPHINAGCMTEAEIAMLRPVSASMGIMLESASERLCERGMPHYGSPDKQPEVRLATIEAAGRAAVPFTSGILIGIGETRTERIEALLELRRLHHRYSHLQEVIVQNFRAKPDTKMSEAPEPDLEDLLWTIAVTRIIFGSEMSIQAPPNLSPGVLPKLINAGINDWGGVSPLTPDYVNPEAPWPHLDKLARETSAAGKHFAQRLTIYPEYAKEADRWLDSSLHTAVLHQSEAEGFAREDNWVAGGENTIPAGVIDALKNRSEAEPVTADFEALLSKAERGERLSEGEVVRLFKARGSEFSRLCAVADRVRQRECGDDVAYVVNRNINYTNVCYFKCQFCAFSKGKMSENLRGRPYDLDHSEIARRVTEAWERGATEVCMQGGIHPDYTGETYLQIVRTVKQAAPDMHIHAFSPLEVWQGAETLGISLKEFLTRLKEAGLGTLPGTAAEVLHEEVRQVLCPDKINTEQWFEVIQTAHEVGLKTTATIMYGHVDRPEHWASHLLRVRDLQAKTGGFTELVPLAFVPIEAPLYLKGKARKGPSFREVVLMHAISRLVLNPLIKNIQASWVKLGEQGVELALRAGCNDLGGTLMNETITRAAGAEHGQEFAPAQMEALAARLERPVSQRTTLYTEADVEQQKRSLAAVEPVSEVINTPLRSRGERATLIATG